MARELRTVIVTLPQTDDEFAKNKFSTDTHKNSIMRMSTSGVLCIEDRYGNQIQFYPEGTWIGAHTT